MKSKLFFMLLFVSIFVGCDGGDNKTNTHTVGTPNLAQIEAAADSLGIDLKTVVPNSAFGLLLRQARKETITATLITEWTREGSQNLTLNIWQDGGGWVWGIDVDFKNEIHEMICRFPSSGDQRGSCSIANGTNQRFLKRTAKLDAVTPLYITLDQRMDGAKGKTITFR